MVVVYNNNHQGYKTIPFAKADVGWEVEGEQEVWKKGGSTNSHILYWNIKDVWRQILHDDERFRNKHFHILCKAKR